MSISAGTKLGPYEIISALGAGGMGEVYRARDTKLHRDVALKVLPPLVADDPDRLARFRREAQVLAALNHPNIAQIHGFEDSGSTHALVMELVEGPTLADRLAPGPLSIKEAVGIARQIADALEAAHDKGIVHRDLKPANVKVREDGAVKVLDFGLAKAMDQSAAPEFDPANSPTLTARATQLGVILGTAAYMAPEQAKGRAVDKRADIWAFGVVLFEMITGQRAFQGDDASDVLAAVLRQELDWNALPADTPAGLRRLLRRCLDRDPRRRLRDIGDALFDLDASAEPAPAAPAAAIAPPKQSALAALLPWAAVVIVAVGAVAWALLRTPPASPRIVTRAVVPLKEPSLFVNISRDGSRLAYNVVGGTNTASIALRMMDQFEAKIVPGSAGGVAPLFSPDGQWIAYGTIDAPRRMRKIPVTGGTSVPICDGDLFAGGSWGDDDTIVFSAPKGLMRVASGGGTPEALTTLDAKKGETAHTRPQFLPGGKQLLFTVIAASGPGFAVLDLSSRQYRTIAKGGVNGRYVGSGHLIYMRGATIFAVPFDLAHLAVTGTEVPVVEGVSTNGPPGTGDFAVSDAGMLVYLNTDSANQGTTLAWADRKGGTQVLPGQAQQRWGTGRLSPDGRRVANAVTSDKEDSSDIWVFDVERGTGTRLSFGGTNDLPIWTPDGRRIIYAGTADGKPSLSSVPADGSGRPEALKVAVKSPRPSSFTPDGKTLLYDDAGGNGKRQIFVLPLGGQPADPHPLHDAQATEFNGQISPDGRWVAYESTESGGSELYVHPFPGPGAKLRVSAQGASKTRWSHDGRTLYFWGSVASQLMEVEIPAGSDLRPSAPKGLFQMIAGTTWDVTPSHDRFLVELTATSSGAMLATVTNWFDELQRRAPAKK